MSVDAWYGLDAVGRHNLFNELFPALQARYPSMEVHAGVDFYSEYEPKFYVPQVGWVTLDGEKKGINVDITEGTLVYPEKTFPWEWFVFGGVVIAAVSR